MRGKHRLRILTQATYAVEFTFGTKVHFTFEEIHSDDFVENLTLLSVLTVINYFNSRSLFNYNICYV